MKTLTRWAVVLGLLTVGLVLGYVLYQWWAEPRVIVTTVVRAPVIEAFYATGTLQPDREYPVQSSVEGLVVQVDVDKGDFVRKDQQLAVMRADDYIMRFEQAKAELNLRTHLYDENLSPVLREFDARIASAKEQLDIAQRERARIEDLVSKRAASVVDLDRSSQVYQDYSSLHQSLIQQRAARQAELLRDLEVAQQAMNIAQWNMDRQTIRSPIDGQVLDYPITQGSRVPINSHLMVVADISPKSLIMRADVDEEDKIRLVPGQSVVLMLYAYPGKPFRGHVKLIYPKANTERRTFEVDVQIDEPDDRFAAGMTGELAFIVQEKQQSLVVPSQAVVGDKVWVVEDGRARPVEVSVGIRSIERTEILAGVSENATIIITPVDDLTPGHQVRTASMTPDEAAGLNAPPKADNFKGFR